ncbi:uncharacterized protein ARMOST_02601 [Armillaria ostoyae]|uniref:Uncharacterized protein n=1 Tax=Armillaria ostoyae TaxID=47428 RepID=A0A284QS50_ARMOS|nr:uncharacterized protein ARMOST_02601 [Armillaria ostoyae]
MMGRFPSFPFLPLHRGEMFQLVARPTPILSESSEEYLYTLSVIITLWQSHFKSALLKNFAHRSEEVSGRHGERTYKRRQFGHLHAPYPGTKHHQIHVRSDRFFEYKWDDNDASTLPDAN